MEPTRVVELRQYILRPGRRDALIELFEREFIESQEACGMRLLGQFRDCDDADRFVWLRGFADMPSRARALAAFYGGSVWKAHREAANATMVDSDNVLLLRPAWGGAGFAACERSDDARAPSQIVATLCELRRPVDDGFIRWFRSDLLPALRDVGAAPLACLQAETADNNFPALPVRSGENSFVWFTRFDDADAHDHHAARLAESRPWTELLEEHLTRPPAQLRLAATRRSRLR